MAFSKITLNGTILMDVTDTSAAAGDVASGKWFYGADGVKTEGTSSGGGGITPVDPKDVNFIDYDGTIVYSYTKSEFAQLSALPANPSHTGLTAQGWNWTKNEITAQLTAIPDQPVWVGQMYVTASGKTEIDIELKNPDLLSPYLKFAVNGTAVVDWGDGSDTDTVTGTSLSTILYTPHTYASTGNYTISINVTSGSFTLRNNYILSHTNAMNNASLRYNAAIVAVRLGSGVTSLGNYAFSSSYSLRYVTIPSSVTSIGSYLASSCYSLQSATVPSGVTSLGSYAFGTCYTLKNVSMPSGMTSLVNYGLQYTSSLRSVTIPNGVTSIGDSEFYGSYSLQSVTIPGGVTSIGTSAFRYCYSLYKMTFKPAVPPTVSDSNAFSSLPTDCVIYVPSGKLTAYTTATNYPDPNTYTYMEET